MVVWSLLNLAICKMLIYVCRLFEQNVSLFKWIKQLFTVSESTLKVSACNYTHFIPFVIISSSLIHFMCMYGLLQKGGTHMLVELQEKTGFYISISGRPRVPTTSGTSNICQSLFTRKVLWGVVHTKRFRLQPRKKELKKKISRNYTCFYRLWRKIFKNQVLIVVEVEAAAGGAHHRQIFCTDWKVNGIWLFLYGHWFQKRVRLCACACSIKQKQNLFSTYFRLLQYEIEQRSILECPKQQTAMEHVFPV